MLALCHELVYVCVLSIARAAGVAREAELVPTPARIDTVFIGGGTPGLLAPRDLARLLEVIRARCGGAPREWSIELAPGSVTEERLTVLRAIDL